MGGRASNTARRGDDRRPVRSRYDLRFTTAAGHCGEAADEIQRAYPELVTSVTRPALADELERLPTTDASELLTTISRAIGGFDAASAHLSPRVMLAAGSAASWLMLAYQAVANRLPRDAE